MGSKGDVALSNPSGAPEKDLTLPRDQENAEDADGTIKRLRAKIQALWDVKRELELLHDDSRKKLHRAEADNRSLVAEAKQLEVDLAAIASASKDLDAETDCLKRALRDLEVDEAEISALKEWKDIDLRVEVRDSGKRGEATVEEQVKITEAREGELQQVVKTLEEANTRLEMELAECRSQIDRHLEMQGGHDAAVAAARRRLKVSQVVAAVASVGALAAVAVAVYLHHGNPRKSGKREL
uniref:Tropomyosin alpha-1 chain-like n=1 Tax=Elaeis guineensis var. tenera TaxID=51953 RepID=A0A6J0PL26_ELAGV|nr:tropomyosin alpha-1 chain-like [Elaeis guineensis]